MYLVMIVNKKAKVTTLGITESMELSWIDGQIGACPIFEHKKDALEYTDGREEIIIEVVENE